VDHWPAWPAFVENRNENQIDRNIDLLSPGMASRVTLVAGFLSLQRISPRGRVAVLLSAVLGLVSMTGHSAGAKSRFTPRFVSVRAKPANVRRGPGTDYAIKWTYVRRWEPVEVFEQYGNWRRVRDWQGNTGWMLEALLSQHRRTALVTPWSHGPNVSLRDRPSTKGRILAWLKPGVKVQLAGCDGKWCRSSVRSINGFIMQVRLWGAYPGERF
jgi:SH3-like domain-containing protein